MASLSILLLDTEPRTRNAYITLAIADALRGDPRVARVVLAEHGSAIRVFQEEGLDTFVAFGGARMHAPLLTRLAALARHSILWTTEDPYEVDNNVRFGTGFDHVFTNDRAALPAYGGRAHHLPLAAAPRFQDLPVLSRDSDYRYDLLFIGTAWPNRVRSLNAILAGTPNRLKVKLALPYNAFIGPPLLDDPSPITDWRCGNADFARFANRSRVVLTLPRAFSTSSEARAIGSTPPPRLFETALAGGFQVMVSAEPETRDYYADGAEIRLCAGDSEAVAAITEALAEPERRIATAQAARERTLRQHLYAQRVARMLDIVEGGVSTKVAAPVRPKRKTILYVTHNRAGYRPGGGVEVYQEVLRGLEGEYEILFLFPVLRDGNTELHLEGPSLHRTFEVTAKMTHRSLTDPIIEGIFEEILFRHRIDLVHVHHLIELPLSLPVVAQACGVPTIYQLHDHFLICDRFLLLDGSGRFCDVVHRGSQLCDTCMLDVGGFPPGSKARRDRFMATVVRGIDAFITSTPFAGAYLRGFYPEIEPDRIVAIEMLTPGASVARERLAHRGGGDLTVAVLGNFATHKGGEDMLRLIRLCQDYPIRFKVFGHVDGVYRDRLQGLPPGRVTLVGAYDQANIIGLLDGCDVSLHLSIWPETFLIALGEAWKAGLVPIVTGIGALAERVSDGIDGFTVPVNAPGAVLERLLDLHFDRDRLAAMRAAAAAKSFITAEAHLAAIGALYERLTEARPCPHDRVPDRIDADYNLALFDAGIRVNARRWTSSDIAWDADYAAALVNDGVHAAVGPERLVLTHDLPPEHAALPERVLDLGRSDGDWWLDELKIDDRPAASRTGCDVVLRSFNLRGWLRADPAARPEATYLRIEGPEGTRYARLAREHRPDLARDADDQVSPQTGFGGRVAVGEFATGVHGIDLIQIVDGRRARASRFLRLYLSPGIHTDRPLSWQPDWEGTVGTDGGGRIGPVRQNLPQAAGIPVAIGSDVWAFEARGSLDAAPDAVFALLRPEGGGRPWWTRAHWRPDAGPDAASGCLTFAAGMKGVPPGRYRLGFVFGEDAQARLLDPGLDLVMSPDTARCRYDAEPPDGFRPRFAKRAGSGFALDWIGPAGTATRPSTIRCGGWAFLPGYGAPLATFAAWTEDGRARYCISAAIGRPDVAEHLGDAAALESGFHLGFPEEALRRGTVKVFQRYAGRTVELAGLRRKISAGPGAG